MNLLKKQREGELKVLKESLKTDLDNKRDHLNRLNEETKLLKDQILNEINSEANILQNHKTKCTQVIFNEVSFYY